ncbi:hypothetical protein BpHYR1_037814 [Brachionus plicatilis]|uniref:Uncharacterized protein n=1 Tax=Brachionus plicatilis TaxID=10195 RepID=A0A3M7QL67_BRAPC|nr:hypothetical protein BpHYR1_037814 [Brachionus plicatilis]
MNATNLKQFVLLQSLTGHIQRQVVRVDYAAYKAQILGQQVVHRVADEHSPHIAGRVLANVQYGLERDLALGHKVRVHQRLLRVLGERLVKLNIFIIGDVSGLALPYRLGRVHQLPVPHSLGHFFCLLFVRLDLGVLLGLGVLFFGLHRHIFAHSLARPQKDVEVDKLGVLGDDVT